MSDQRVVALFYDIEHRPSVVYREEEPHYEEGNFSVRIENKEVRFTMKAHYATEAEAKEAVREYIDNWEFTAGLRKGPDMFKLVYQKAQIEDRNAEIGHHRVNLDPVSWKSTVPPVAVTLTTSYPPPPQSGMKITPDVQSMYERLMGYRLGREPLPSMAYFCVTVLENSAGVLRKRKRAIRRRAVAEQYGIEQAVLDKIGNLSSEKGGQQARKANGTSHPLTESEARFLKKAIPALIRRAAEVAHDPNKSGNEIKLSDFCS